MMKQNLIVTSLHHKYSQYQRSEQGFVLLVAMVFLIALAVLSMWTMTNSVLQQKMATVHDDMSNTFLASENIVFALNEKLKENDLQDINFLDSYEKIIGNTIDENCGRGLFNINVDDATLPWNDASTLDSIPDIDKNFGFDATRTHQYMVTQPPLACISREIVLSAEMGGEVKTDFYWAISKGANVGDTVIITQHSIIR